MTVEATQLVQATLGLGANLGDPVAAFAMALKRLRAEPNISLIRLSQVYRTAPWGKLDQPEFLNMAVLIETGSSPQALLDLALAIERESGRERREIWGPRILDIDILTYGTRVISEAGLEVPHPRITGRAFVLVPLADIAPQLEISGRPVSAWRAAVGDAGVRADEAATDRLAGLLA